MPDMAADPARRTRPRDASADDRPGATERAGDPEADLERLRAILNAPERRRIAELAARLEDHARAHQVSLVLPEAVALRSGDPQLTRALTPSVEEAITRSVRRNPKPLADALFPVMGPAIRRAIAHALGAMLETLNRTVEQSLSWRAVKWRWTALRTGRPYAEVVLLDTLLYRVEQLFLVHRETGLLLQQVTAEGVPAQDPDMVSGMLTAIRDFVHDSFGAKEEAVVEAMDVGELSVIVEQGPMAMLAAVVRGTAPPTLRETLQDALETIHLRRADDLANFAGDNSPFDETRPVLQACLQAGFRPTQAHPSRRWVLATAAVLVALVAWTAWSWWQARRFAAYLDALRAQPGIVVVESGRRGGTFFVHGLRDPLAVDPGDVLASSGLAGGRVAGRWTPYQALEARFVLARARGVLRPPDSVSLELRDGILIAAGAAESRWIADAERLAPLVPGVHAFDASGTAPADLARLSREIAATTLRFQKGRIELVPDQDGALRQLAARLRELDALVATGRARVSVEITGHADADGGPGTNEPLSLQRANAALTLLAGDGWDALRPTVRGAGSSEPIVTGASEIEKQQNRRVSFRVTATPDAPGGGRER